MEQGVFDKLYELERWYWWFVGRRYVLDKLLDYFLPAIRSNGLIVDFGCGTGGTMEMLQKRGPLLGLDIEQRALDFCKSKGFYNVALMKGFYDTGLTPNSVDLITALDVLEHFEDDERGLREIARILKPGAHALITVPAFSTLWSELDEYAHHFRRYKRRDLEAKLARAGLKPVKSSYMFFFVFPLVLLYRLIGNLRRKKAEPQFKYVEFPWILDRILVFFSKLESWLLKFTRFPFGSSVVVIAKKQ